MEIYRTEDFGVENITNLFEGVRPLSYGAAITKHLPSGNNLVLALVRPDKDGDCNYESVGGRIETYCETWDEVLAFRRCVRVAFEEVELAFNKEEASHA